MRTRVELEIIVDHDEPLPERESKLLEAIWHSIEGESLGGAVAVVDEVERVTIKKVDVDHG